MKSALCASWVVQFSCLQFSEIASCFWWTKLSISKREIWEFLLCPNYSLMYQLHWNKPAFSRHYCFCQLKISFGCLIALWGIKDANGADSPQPLPCLPTCMVLQAITTEERLRSFTQFLSLKPAVGPHFSLSHSLYPHTAYQQILLGPHSNYTLNTFPQ